MDEVDTLENIFGFENKSESDSEGDNEVTVVSENRPEAGADGEAPAEPPKRRINRKPIPKLDSNVLLSENGIRRLQTLLSKTSFKRGKGHEKENLNRLINVYQLWGHNLYPRLKFKSIIERTEKLCCEKRLKVVYSTWKEANKYRRKYETDEYNTSGIIRAEDDPTAEVGGDSFNMDIDIFKPFPGANTSTTTTTITTTTTTTIDNNSNSNSITNPPLPLSRLDHPLTEEERAFMRANRERALQKLRQKKEELKRQRELEQQQKQQQQQSILEQASTSTSVV